MVIPVFPSDTVQFLRSPRNSTVVTESRRRGVEDDSEPLSSPERHRRVREALRNSPHGQLVYDREPDHTNFLQRLEVLEKLDELRLSAASESGAPSTAEVSPAPVDRVQAGVEDAQITLTPKRQRAAKRVKPKKKGKVRGRHEKSTQTVCVGESPMQEIQVQKKEDEKAMDDFQQLVWEWQEESRRERLLSYGRFLIQFCAPERLAIKDSTASKQEYLNHMRRWREIRERLEAESAEKQRRLEETLSKKMEEKSAEDEQRWRAMLNEILAAKGSPPSLAPQETPEEIVARLRLPVDKMLAEVLEIAESFSDPQVLDVVKEQKADLERYLNEDAKLNQVEEHQLTEVLQEIQATVQGWKDQLMAYQLEITSRGGGGDNASVVPTASAEVDPGSGSTNAPPDTPMKPSLANAERVLRKMEEVSRKAATISAQDFLLVKRILSFFINTLTNPENRQKSREIVDKLALLLSGRPCQMMDPNDSRALADALTRESTRAAIYNETALKFVMQYADAYEDAAWLFGTASVMLKLWKMFPDFGDLVQARFFENCPYLIPKFYSQKPGQDRQDYYRQIGYCLDDEGNIETDNTYQKVMGSARLYFAMMQIPVREEEEPHPLPLSLGWRWLNEIMEYEPRQSVTITAIHEFLKMVGNKLPAIYGQAFTEIIYRLRQDYLPRACAVAEKGTGGTAKLRKFQAYLDDVLKNQKVPPPMGKPRDEVLLL